MTDGPPNGKDHAADQINGQGSSRSNGVLALAGGPHDYIANEFQRACLLVRQRYPEARSLLVTGPRGGVGTTTVATLCAIALADIGGGTVVLVDANLRAPALHRRFGLNGAAGLRGWDPARPSESVHPVAHERLLVMPAGTRERSRWAGSLHALHRSGRLETLAARLRDGFAFVVWDTPPMNSFPDARFLLPFVDGVLVVAEADITSLEELENLYEQIAPYGCPVLGVILNRTGRFLGGPRPPAPPRGAPRAPRWSEGDQLGPDEPR